MIYGNILALCKERNLSIAALEKSCGLGNATVRGWKTSTPSVATLKKVADYFGVTLDELTKEVETCPE